MLGFHGISVAPISALVTTQATGLPAGKQNFTTINGLAYAISLRTWTQSLNNTTLAPAVVQIPFNQYDWPNPKAPVFPQSLRSWLQIPYIEAIPPAQRPFRKSDWPNPRASQRGLQQQQRFQSLNLSTLSVPFRQLDWPNPKATQRPTFTRQPQNLALTTLTPAPFAFMAWTLPIGVQRALGISYTPFSFALNHPFIPPPPVVPDCGHLFPSTTVLASLTEAFYTAGILTEGVSVAGSQRSAISKSGSTRSSASKAGSMKPEIPC